MNLKDKKKIGNQIDIEYPYYYKYNLFYQIIIYQYYLQMRKEYKYHDKMDIYKRQKLYEKMLSNYDRKIYTTKKQQQEQIRSKTLNPEKIEELNEQIKDYERKNKEYLYKKKY